MVDLVQLPWDVYVGADVLRGVLEISIAFQMRYVLEGAGYQVVHAGYAVALGEEPLAQMAPHKAGPTRHERPGFSGPDHGFGSRHARKPGRGGRPQ